MLMSLARRPYRGSHGARRRGAWWAPPGVGLGLAAAVYRSSGWWPCAAGAPRGPACRWAPVLYAAGLVGAWMIMRA
ncbi:hypothetical protein GCM10010299_13100 [Streptomyces tanashiensis]|nr:hypothetical protein GCM10010299_13100 [Streptomyces tanashiensis]